MSEAINVNVTMYCGGTQSCVDSLINGTGLICNGYDSCSNSTIITRGFNPQWCEGYGACRNSHLNASSLIGCDSPFSCSDTTINLYGTGPYFQCEGLHTCMNMTLKSPSSYSTFLVQKLRFIYGALNGIFSGHNSTIYSNGNNVYLIAQGYYAAYKTTVKCSGANDICVIECYGNSCVGLTMMCNSSATCDIKCGDDACYNYDYQSQIISFTNDHDDKLVSSNQTKSNLDQSFDGMVDFIDSILGMYDKNYHLSPKNVTYIDWIKMDEYCANSKYLFTSYHEGKNRVINFNHSGDTYTDTNNNVCCLATSACENITAIGYPHASHNKNLSRLINIFCGGYRSCQNSTICNINNIYSSSPLSLDYSNVSNFDGVVFCFGETSCAYSKISNGSLVLCIGGWACVGAEISNVNIIIGIGAQGLSNAVLSNIETMIILGADETTSNANIYNITQTFSLYCQDDACNAINTPNVDIYCYNQSYVSITIDDQTFTATDLKNFKHCSIHSQSPTKSPTIAPKESQFERELSNIVSFLQKLTVIVAIIVVIVSLILIRTSMVCHKKKHSQTMENYRMSIMRDTYVDISTHDDDDKDVPVKPWIPVTADSSEINGSETNDSKTSGRKSTIASTVVSYVSGLGKTSSHLIIAEMGFEVYDVFTDTAYLINLFEKEEFGSFYVFLISIGLTLVVNGILLLVFFQSSFRNMKFQKWFFNYSGMIICLFCFCLLTDACIVVSLFTSQIFGHSIFYSPLRLGDIRQMKIAAFLSLFIEHLPQISVQCYQLFVVSENNTPIVVAAFIVNIIGIVITVFRMFFWFVVVKEMRLK